MTKEEAVAVAKGLAESKGWTWLEPVHCQPGARRLNKAVRTWEVHTNANSRGASMRVLIDDETGEVLESGYLPR